MNTLLMSLQVYCAFFQMPEMYLKESRELLACSSMRVVVEEAKKNDIDPEILMALIYVESGWKRTAVSHAGACGLTQVIPKYTGTYSPVKKYTCKQLKDPHTSIKVGARILRFWIDHHKGNVKRGLCGYNAGFRCRGSRPNKHGMRYAKKILNLEKKIEKFISIQK